MSKNFLLIITLSSLPNSRYFAICDFTVGSPSLRSATVRCIVAICNFTVIWHNSRCDFTVSSAILQSPQTLGASSGVLVAALRNWPLLYTFLDGLFFLKKDAAVWCDIWLLITSSFYCIILSYKLPFVYPKDEKGKRAAQQFCRTYFLNSSVMYMIRRTNIADGIMFQQEDLSLNVNYSDEGAGIYKIRENASEPEVMMAGMTLE